MIGCAKIPLAASLSLALLAGHGARAQEAPPPGAAEAVELRVDPGTVLARIAPDFTGFGYETSAVAQTGFFSAKNTVMVQLYRTLSPHGLARIGGNVSDHTRYVADGVAVPRPQTGVTIINRAGLQDLGEFLRATGWQAIWGLNLATGSKEEAAEEARAVVAALGAQLHSFEIGNEVESQRRFRNYDAYHAAYVEYKAAIRAALPQAAFSGPDAAGDAGWCARFAADEGGDLRLLTDHYYRADAAGPLATLATLLAPDPHLDQSLATLRSACRERHLPYRFCEVNSFYRGGKPGASDTFGSALWGLDYQFQLAASGGSGVNMETDVNHLGWVSHYSPIFRDGGGALSARPLYYGMLAFALAANGELIQLARDGAVAVNLSAYATRDAQDRVWVTVVNKDLAKDVAASIAVPGKRSGARVYALRAPTPESKDRVTLAGAEVAADGTWAARPTDLAPAPDGKWRVPVPHASAVVLQLLP